MISCHPFFRSAAMMRTVLRLLKCRPRLRTSALLPRLPGKREIDWFFWLPAALSVDKCIKKTPIRPVTRQRRYWPPADIVDDPNCRSLAPLCASPRQSR